MISPDEVLPVDPVRAVAERAKSASRGLATLSEERRNRVLERMADAVAAASGNLFAANALDLKAAERLQGAEAISAATMSRLKLDERKLREMMEQIRSVAALPDPLGRVLDALELDDGDPPKAVNTQVSRERLGAPGPGVLTAGLNDTGAVQAARREAPGAREREAANAKNGLSGSGREHGLHLQKVSVPLGVLAVIFEARPDAVTQIAALALKSGNALILKAGREVEHTATALVAVLRGALTAEGVAEDAVSLITGREQVAAVLALHDLVDMVIPRGSKQLVEYVQANTRIPVLGHSEGVCHIYVDQAADLDLALRVIADAKLDYPAACNAVETVLVHREIAQQLVPRLVRDLQGRAVRLHGDAAVRAVAEDAAVLPVGDWHTEYGEAEMSVGIVDSVEAAIAHIHRYGSSHTESILTENTAVAEQFLREVDAAGVFHNASTRFADGFRYGFGAEVGISTSKLHARGPVGVEGLTTYKYVLRGAGHMAGEYRGARAFTHRREAADPLRD